MTSRQGFTLVEMMVTTVLLAVIMPAVMKGLSIILMLTSQASHRAIALNLAESKLAELIATGEWENSGQEGTFEKQSIADMIYAKEDERLEIYTWKYTAEESDSLKELRLTVEWISRGVEKSLTLTTLKLPEEE